MLINSTNQQTVWWVASKIWEKSNPPTKISLSFSLPRKKPNFNSKGRDLGEKNTRRSFKFENRRRERSKEESFNYFLFSVSPLVEQRKKQVAITIWADRYDIYWFVCFVGEDLINMAERMNKKWWMLHCCCCCFAACFVLFGYWARPPESMRDYCVLIWYYVGIMYC